MNRTRRNLFVRGAACVFAAMALQSVATAADEFPQRAVHFVVPYAPGGSADTLARALGERLGKELGQSIIVENRGGGGGVVGAGAVSRARPDGHTVFLGGTGFNVIAPMLGILEGGFNPDEDLVPISKIASYRILLVVHPDSPIRSFEDLIAQAKSPKGVSYGTAGVTTTPHIGALALQKEAGVTMIHAPYKGEAPAALDVMGGQIDMSINGEAAVMSNIRAGKLRPILTMYPTRLESLPDVPSITEFYPDLATDPWFGVFGTPGTPPEVIDRLAEAIRIAVNDEAVAARLKENFYVPSASESAAEFRQSLESEKQAWRLRLEGVDLGKK